MVFDSANALEAALAEAVTDPSRRPQFYRELGSADLYIFQDSPKPLEGGAMVIPEGAKISFRQVVQDGVTYIPVFSSPIRLQEVTQGTPSYIVLSALEFFRLTRGANVLLNPGSHYSKQFSAAEIADLLDSRLLEPPQECSIGQAARHPQALQDALAAHFAGVREVKRAYIAHFFNPAADAAAHTLVGIEVEGDPVPIVQAAQKAVAGVELFDPPLQFIQLGTVPAVDKYFEESCKPFHRRKRFGLF
jgi:hypothetical protein